MPNLSSSTTNTTALESDLRTHLTTKHLPPTTTWLSAFITSLPPTNRPPLPGLRQTATFRLLNSDITTSISPSAPPAGAGRLPDDVLNATTRERTINGTVLVQVLDVEDLSTSRWSQVEEIEARERGEMTKGREIIRVTEEDANATSSTSTAGESMGGGGNVTHKLLLQDASGAKVYAVEAERVKGVHLEMGIGCKMLLKDVVVARGVVLLESGNVEVLGGKVEGLQRAWKEGRKEKLKGLIDHPEGG